VANDIFFLVTKHKFDFMVY